MKGKCSINRFAVDRLASLASHSHAIRILGQWDAREESRWTHVILLRECLGVLGAQIWYIMIGMYCSILVVCSEDVTTGIPVILKIVIYMDSFNKSLRIVDTLGVVSSPNICAVPRSIQPPKNLLVMKIPISQMYCLYCTWLEHSSVINHTYPLQQQYEGDLSGQRKYWNWLPFLKNSNLDTP